MDWLELAQSIQNGKLSSFYLLAGEDEWQVSQCLASLAQLIPQDIRLHNIMRVAGRNLRPSDLEQYRQTTLFGDEKLLVIEEPRFLRTARQGEESASDKQDNSDESAWQQGLREISQELCLVLVHPGNIDRRRRMSKWLESNATVVNCNPLKRAPMLSIIRSELQRQSLSVEYGVPELIQEIAGEAPGIAFQEIIKLKTAFPEKRRLTLQEVRQVLAPSADAEVFTLLDLLAEEKLEEAFTLLDDLLRRGETVPRLIASVARQVRQMLQLRALEQRGMRVDAATKALELHPYAAQRLVEKAVAYSNADLITLLRDCCDKDSRLKSGRLGMTSAIDILLLQMYRLRSQSRRRRSG